MNYEELVADKTTLNSIRGWTNWSVAPAESILAEAEAVIYAKLRSSEMEALDAGTIAEGDTSLELPVDFISAKSFRRVGESAGEITVLDRQHFEERLALDTDGSYFAASPTECTIYGTPATAYFNTAADADVSYRLLYFAQPAPLSVSNQTNWLTSRYPLVIRATCLWLGFLFKKELQLAQVWASIAAGLMDAVNGNGDLAQAIVNFEIYSKKAI